MKCLLCMVSCRLRVLLLLPTLGAVLTSKTKDIGSTPLYYLLGHTHSIIIHPQFHHIHRVALLVFVPLFVCSCLSRRNCHPLQQWKSDTFDLKANDLWLTCDVSVSWSDTILFHYLHVVVVRCKLSRIR